MLRILTSITVVCLVLPLLGCGQDGDDGDSYIAYSWPTTDTIEFLDFEVYRDSRSEEFRSEHQHVRNDPAFPDSGEIENGQYRDATEGHWGIAYLLSSGGGGGYWATYEIFIEEGETAQLFSDGADGDDLYFELVCGDPAEFHVWESPVRSTSDSLQRVHPIASLRHSGPGAAPESYSFRTDRFKIVFRYGSITAGEHRH